MNTAPERPSWLGRYAQLVHQHDEAMIKEVNTGIEPDASYWEGHGMALEQLAHEAAPEIASLRDRVSELEGAIERIEYAWNGSEYVTGEGVQRLDAAVTSAVNLLPEGE